MARNLGPEYGVQGEFYVGDLKDCGQTHTPDIITYNDPPSTQPALWCNWRPTEDGQYLEWDGGEKAYDMQNWIVYLCREILDPRGYRLKGHVDARGEESDDHWCIDALPQRAGTAIEVSNKYSAYLEDDQILEDLDGLEQEEIVKNIARLSKKMNSGWGKNRAKSLLARLG